MGAAPSATPRSVLAAMLRTDVRSVRDLDIAVAALLILRPAPSAWRGTRTTVHHLLTRSEPTLAVVQVFATVPAAPIRAEARLAAEHLPAQWNVPELLADVLSASEERAAADLAAIHSGLSVDEPAMRSALAALVAADAEAPAAEALGALRELVQPPAPNGLEWPTLASMRLAAIRGLHPRMEQDAPGGMPIRLRTLADPAPPRWNRPLTLLGPDLPFTRERPKFTQALLANVAATVGADEPPLTMAAPEVNPPLAHAEPPPPPVNRRPTKANQPKKALRRERKPAKPTSARAKPETAAREPKEIVNRTVERRLQVLIRDATTDEPRGAAFRRAVAHVVGVYVSPGDLGGLVADAPVPERDLKFISPEQGQPAVAALEVDFISPGPGGAQTLQTKQLSVPRSGPSTAAEFELWAPATATTLSCTIVLRRAHTVLQTATLRGPVADDDVAPPGEELALNVAGEFVRDIADPNANAPATTPVVQASISTNVGGSEQAIYVPEDGRPVMVSLASTSVLRGRIEDTLREALDVEAAAIQGATRAAARARTELLRSLAQQGSALWQEMEPLHGMTRLQHIQIVSGDDDTIPFEFIYDLGYPSDDATLCRKWRAALTSGTCSCLDGPRTPKEAAKRGLAWESKTVCPLGFWGLRVILERQVASSAAGSTLAAGMPDGQRTRLAPMSSVLFAASTKVDGASDPLAADSLADEPASPDGAKDAAAPASLVAQTSAALRANPRITLAEATTWTDWRRQIKSAKPGLLLAIPHNELADNGQSRLEIGAGSFVNVGALDPAYVLAPQPRRRSSPRSSSRAGSTAAAEDVEPVGPVVFLLGCNTAADELPWQTAAAAFRRLGAAVVVGTLIQALGRQSAPLAQMLGDLLWGESSVRAETMGEVIVAIRRQLVLKGMTLGMSLIAFGHASWLLPAPDEA